MDRSNMADASKDERTKRLQIYPPSSVYLMKELDKEAFRRKVSLPFIRAEAICFIEINQSLKSFYLKIRAFKPIVVEDDKVRKIYLNPDLFDEKVISKIQELKSKLLADEDGKVIKYEDYEIGYDNFGYHDILRAVLPDNLESISGYSSIGHIIHLNLRDEMLPFKRLIGQVLLDKVTECRMVVNKINIIETQFRNFQMETLAETLDEEGKSMGTIVNTSESGVRYRFDFAKVYWNPRLSAERARIGEKLNKSVDVLYDAFAGVGPFAITAAKFNKCRVVANDLNPESYRWLLENVRLNRVQSLVSCHNLDARDFIKKIVKQDLIEAIHQHNGSDLNRKYHVVMNLPDMAPQFLDVFDGLLAGVEVTSHHDYRIPGLEIHCYSFVKQDSLLCPDEAKQKEYLLKLCEDYLGHRIDLENDVQEIFNVRKVAPKKDMYRISFHLRQDILYGETKKEERDREDCGIEAKKLKVQ